MENPRESPMNKKFNTFDTRPIVVEQTSESAVVTLTNKAKLSLLKKSENSGISYHILEQVYSRGYSIWNETFDGTPEQFAFDRVNSFISGGFALQLDEDLMDISERKRGLWDNIHAKRERIKHGSGEHMRKPGQKGAPTPEAIRAAQKEEVENAETISTNFEDPSARFVGSDQLRKVYERMTPGQSDKTEKRINTIRKTVNESLYEQCENCNCMNENWQNSKYKNPSGGLTKAGVMAYRREHPGSKLKTAVTTEPSKLKKGSKAANRRKSFCARMSGMKKRLTSAKTARDPDSRINKSLRKWHC